MFCRTVDKWHLRAHFDRICGLWRKKDYNLKKRNRFGNLILLKLQSCLQ